MSEKVPDNLPEPLYLSLKQAAALSGLSEKFVRRSVKSGSLPASDLGTPGRPFYRVSREDLDGWMESRKTTRLKPEAERPRFWRESEERESLLDYRRKKRQ